MAPAPWTTPNHPTAQPYVAPPVAVPSTLTGWLQGVMWATAGLAVIAGVLGFAAKSSYNDYVATRPSSVADQQAYDDWISMDDAFSSAEGFIILSWIAMFVLTIVWMNKAHKATQRLWPGPRKWSAGWTVGGWFIPLAQFVIPKLVLNEIERIAKSPRWGGHVDARWKDQSTSALGWLWWIGTSGSILLMTIGGSLAGDLDVSVGDMRSWYDLQSVGLFVAAVSLALGAIFMRRVGRRLSPAGMAETL